MTQTNVFVCLLLFVPFTPNINFKHTRFQANGIIYRILRGVDSYGFVTPCIGNMSSRLHIYIVNKIIELFEWQQQHHHLQNIFGITITLRR